MLLCGVCFGQTDPKARPTYASNGVLIELAGLAPLRDCPVMALKGKVKKVKRVDDAMIFVLSNKQDRMTFQFPINRVAPSDQPYLSKNFLRKNVVLNASGNAAVNFNNVSEVRFYSDGNNYLDNIEIGAANAVVPEPGTIAILLTGLGLIGAMARRRKQ